MDYHHYAARRIHTTSKGAPTGPWYYTELHSRRDDGITTVALGGYCADGCNGHNTAKEAYAHQRTYLLDHASYGATIPGTQHPCLVCRTPTERLAQTDMGPKDSYPLCDAHCDRKGLSKVMGEVGEVISSY